MVTGTDQGVDSVEAIDAILGNQDFRDRPKAMMLIRTCQFAQAMRPEILDHYWAKLKDLQRHVPKDYVEAYKMLKAAIEKPTSESFKGFAREMLDTIGTAFKADGTPEAGGAEILRQCQSRLEKRAWPFGKKPVWIALVKAWADVDRATALDLLPKVSHEVRTGVIHQMNTKSPMTEQEWEQAGAHAPSVIAVIHQILEGDKPQLRLPGHLAERMARELRKIIHFTPPNDEQETKTKERREKGLVKYFKLVNCIVGPMPEVAGELLESLFVETIDTKCFKDKWPEQISMLREILNLWVSYPDLKEKAHAFIKSNDLRHYRDFAIAHWYAMAVKSKEEAAEGLNEIIKECREKKSAEIWYLATLVRRGLGEVALQLAKSSPRASDLLPVVKRAWLLSHPETASSAFSIDDLKDDIIGQFLLLGTYQERVDFLRELTNNGKRSLPPEFWSKPDISRIVRQMQAGQTTDSGDHSLMVLYTRDEKEENYFKQYVRMHGALQYSYDTVDPFLMSTIVVWKEKWPDEVESLLNQMWMVIEPDLNLLMTDVLRNNIFDRCQSVFAGSSECFNNLFVDFVKRKLIDQPIQQHLPNNQIRTLSLKPMVPFWYCLIAAERVAKISAECKEELIKLALAHHQYDEEMVKVAAKVYAANKGLGAIDPPVELGKQAYKEAWQTGVVDCSAREILTLVVADLEAKNKAAQAAS